MIEVLYVDRRGEIVDGSCSSWGRWTGQLQGTMISFQGSNHPQATLLAMAALQAVDAGEPKQEFLCGFGREYFRRGLAKEVATGSQFPFAAAVGQHPEMTNSCEPPGEDME